MTRGEALATARAMIPLAEARLLLAHALGVGAVDLVAHPEQKVSAGKTAGFLALVERRARGEPIAHLVGEREFHGLMFRVTPDVLIPRPETELLVDLALRQPARRILDLGTGSGCVAIAIAGKRPEAQLTAIDLSAAALAVARENAARHQVSVRFLEGDWLAPVAGERFELILANPPYIAAADPHLAQGDLRFEPPAALASGPDGLDAIRQIIGDAPACLEAGAALWLEHGFDQAPAVRQLLEQAGFRQIRQQTDLAGIVRISGGVRP